MVKTPHIRGDGREMKMHEMEQRKALLHLDIPCVKMGKEELEGPSK